MDLAHAVRQMLADPRATQGVGAFYRWWLHLDDVTALKKDPLVFPELTPELQADMAKETETFGVEVTLTLDGSFQTLMTASFSYLNARLASVYGIPGVTGDDLRQTEVHAGQRAGLLTQPSLQVRGSFPARNSPSRRGTHILQTFLCKPVPFPPLGIPGLATPPPGTTMRQAVTSATSDATCAACHRWVDPPGFALESLDAIGRERALDNGAAFDTSATIEVSTPSEARVAGAVELASLLSRDPGAQDCIARQWLSFALGRDLGAADEPSVGAIDAAFSSSFNLQALIVAVLTSDTFLSP